MRELERSVAVLASDHFLRSNSSSGTNMTCRDSDIWISKYIALCQLVLMRSQSHQ